MLGYQGPGALKGRKLVEVPVTRKALQREITVANARDWALGCDGLRTVCYRPRYRIAQFLGCENASLAGLFSAPRETRTPTPEIRDKALNLARLPIPPQARAGCAV
jgi:hypothetical protein